MAAVQQCPFDPGVEGSVALRWDNEQRRYQLIAGWVTGRNGDAIPREVGKSAGAGDQVPHGVRKAAGAGDQVPHEVRKAADAGDEVLHVEPVMSRSDESLENRIFQLEEARSFWKWLALGQLLLLVVVIVAGVTTSGMIVVRARQAEMIAREEARRAQGG
jgi:hypothetical protein